MTGHGDAQPELDEKALFRAKEAVRMVYVRLGTTTPDFRDAQLAEAAVSAYLLAAGGTGEREKQGSEDLHECEPRDDATSPGAPQSAEPETLRQRAGALADAVRLVAGESGDWRPQGRQKRAEWEAALDELEALDAVLTSPSPVSPAGREERNGS